MRSKSYYWIILVIVYFDASFLIGCSNSNSSIQDRIEETNRIIVLAQESIEKEDLSKVKILVQFPESAEPKVVASLQALNEVKYDVLYNVVFSKGKPLAFIEVPFIESGDYKLIISHYFDEKGRTIAYRRKITFFNNDCGEQPVVSEKTIYYDKNERSLLEREQLMDSEGNVIAEGKECVLNYSHNDVVFHNYKKIPFANKIFLR
jgi:hypothetical protein